ncbi:MAG: hypothetical protein WCD81_10365 [Candidatus Bathyarchaeia archaeon]
MASPSEAQTMLRRFLNYHCIVETPAGQVVGILVSAEVSWHRGVGNLLMHEFGGDRWTLIKEWYCLARSST